MNENIKYGSTPYNQAVDPSTGSVISVVPKEISDTVSILHKLIINFDNSDGALNQSDQSALSAIRDTAQTLLNQLDSVAMSSYTNRAPVDPVTPVLDPAHTYSAPVDPVTGNPIPGTPAPSNPVPTQA